MEGVRDILNAVGIFGGAFDPPHIEHINIAKHACEELGLTQLIFLPSQYPPHKVIKTDKEDRLKMLSIAKEFDSRFNIDDYEINQEEITYTYKTVQYLKKKYGDNTFYILGGDSMVDFHKWKKPETIIKNINLAVVYRNESEYGAVDKAISKWRKKGANIKLLKYKTKDISSTELRFYLNIKKDCSDLMLPEIYDFAIQKNLYKDYDFYLDKLSKTLSKNRYLHSLRVAEYALKLNKKLNLNTEKVILAAILHDCAKSDKIMYNYLRNISDKEYAKFKPRIMDNGKYSSVLHAFVGAEIAQRDYNMKDEDIINAIRYHTTGRANMSDLEKIIYVSDFLELDRKHDLDKLREITDNDFEAGFKAIIKKNYEYLLKTKKDKMDKLTEKAYKHYFKNEEV